MDEKRVFLKPGKDNKEDRMNFVKYWANYVKTHSDKEWSRQQKNLIYPQIKNAREFTKIKQKAL